MRKGVGWNVGKVFHRDELVYQFDLLPETGHQRPAFVNLQQYYARGIPGRARAAAAGVELRWKNHVTGVAREARRRRC